MSACGAEAVPPPVPPAPRAPRASADDDTNPDAAVARKAAATLSPEAAALRDQGLAAYDAGDFEGAERALGEALGMHPQNAATRALYDAAKAAVKRAQDKPGVDLSSIAPT